MHVHATHSGKLDAATTKAAEELVKHKERHAGVVACSTNKQIDTGGDKALRQSCYSQGMRA
jgi:hypothetical protein